MADTPATVVLVINGETEVILGQIDPGRPALALVDALMRYQLATRRKGREIRLRDVSDDLHELLELVGLDGVLALEPRRKPERREELRVDEVVQPGDASV